ncbi:MAG: hypothetical protein ACFFBJ_13025 [Promethearchaeota archaeon]
MFQISPVIYIMTTGLTMFLFLSGIAIFIFLEESIANIGRQKRMVYLFMKHPWKVEALIICLLTSFPIVIISITLMAGKSLLSIAGTLVLGWPILMYVFHGRMMDFRQLLGIGRKKEHDPVFVAQLSITVWSIAACGLVLSFIFGVFNISIELGYFLIGPCVMAMILIRIRESLAIVRNHNATTDDEPE